ncbi:MAG: hypothetical protein V1719_00775 [Patescibacteria group bacterium]
MLFLKGLSLGIYYRLRRMNKALKNWRKFGIIIFGSLFVAATLMPFNAVADDLRVEIYQGSLPISSFTTDAGSTKQFTARAFVGATEVTDSVSFRWGIDGKYIPSQVGSITQTGLFTAGTKAGSYPSAIGLTGTLDGKSDIDLVGVTINTSTVIPPITQQILTRVEILDTQGLALSSFTIDNGKTKQFQARAYDQNNQDITNKTSFRWGIDGKYIPSQVGSITQTGLFTAGTKAGSYPSAIGLTGSFAGKSLLDTVSVQINITQPPQQKVIASVNISPDNSTVYIGGQTQYTATAYDQNSNVLTGVSFQWSVISNSSGSINQNGLFTAGNYPGSYANNIKVVATYVSNTAVDYAAITVLSNPVQSTLHSVVINPSAVQLQTGSNYQFTATAYDQNSQVLNDVSFNWTIVNGGGWINQAGKFTAGYETGTYANTIQVLGTKNGITKSAYATVAIYDVITQNLLERVEITPNSTSVGVNNQFDFNAQAYDNNNNPLFNDVSYSWSVISGGGSINQNGLYYAPNYTGMVTVQVQATQGGITRYALATVTVTGNNQPSGEISTVRITPSVAYLNIGSSVDFNAQAYNAYGSPVSADYSWSLMSNIGSIDQNGYFVAGGNIGTYNDVVRVRAYRNGVERVDYADIVISGGQNNYGLTSTLTASDENGGTTNEGDTITYTLQVTNQSNNALTNVHATFEVPQYTSFISVSSNEGIPTINSRTINWDAGTLYANYNYTKTLTVRVRINNNVPANAVVKGKAYVWASEINSFWVYANDLFVAGTGDIDYDDDIPLTDTGAVDWIIAGLTALVGAILSKKFLFKV